MDYDELSDIVKRIQTVASVPVAEYVLFHSSMLLGTHSVGVHSRYLYIILVAKRSTSELVDGYFECDYDTMCSMSGYCKSRVSRCISELEKNRLIEVDRGVYGRVSKYKLLPIRK